MYFLVRRQAINVLGAMLKTGLAFENVLVRDAAMGRLKREFPSKMARWDKAQRAGFTQIRPSPGMLFEAVILCRQLRVFTALPAIFYTICRDCMMVCEPFWICAVLTEWIRMRLWTG